MRKDKYHNNAVKFYEKILLSKYNKGVKVIKVFFMRRSGHYDERVIGCRI